MKLVITGASGLIGSALVREAERNKIEVVKLVRRIPKEKNESQWDPNKGSIDLAALENSTAIVHLAEQPLFQLLEQVVEFAQLVQV